jgi:hypothetical protein
MIPYTCSCMNITEANTEPFYQYHRFNEELNRIMRITVAGLATIGQAPHIGRFSGNVVRSSLTSHCAIYEVT